jgi:hypothetical protein
MGGLVVGLLTGVFHRQGRGTHHHRDEGEGDLRGARDEALLGAPGGDAAGGLARGQTGLAPEPRPPRSRYSWVPRW